LETRRSFSASKGLTLQPRFSGERAILVRPLRHLAHGLAGRQAPVLALHAVRACKTPPGATATTASRDCLPHPHQQHATALCSALSPLLQGPPGALQPLLAAGGGGAGGQQHRGSGLRRAGIRRGGLGGLCHQRRRKRRCDAAVCLV
jgi:hypothetical protein